MERSDLCIGIKKGKKKKDATVLKQWKKPLAYVYKIIYDKQIHLELDIKYYCLLKRVAKIAFVCEHNIYSIYNILYMFMLYKYIYVCSKYNVCFFWR